jgi:formylmethanofuran dehydrogenase subunit E
LVNNGKELESLIKNAEKLHGHLGPFLVIGVRMGSIAERVLGKTEKHNGFEATVKIPLLTPFSCVIDGIQATTQCTVGNQKLKIKSSQKEIVAHFAMRNADNALKITVNSKIVGKLMDEISEGISNEELVRRITYIPENLLFTLEKRVNIS